MASERGCGWAHRQKRAASGRPAGGVGVEEVTGRGAVGEGSGGGEVARHGGVEECRERE
jgi:hypothetical protein